MANEPYTWLCVGTSNKPASRRPERRTLVFDDLNATHFGGQLKQASIWITATRYPRSCTASQ